jgi:hypothetical protein
LYITRQGVQEKLVESTLLSSVYDFWVCWQDVTLGNYVLGGTETAEPRFGWQSNALIN